MSDRQTYDWLLTIVCAIPYLLIFIGLCAPARKIIKARKPPEPPKEH